MTDRLPVEYRTHRGFAATFFVPAGVSLAAAASPFVLVDEVPTWVSVAVCALIGALFVWVVAALRRSATIVHSDRVVIRGAFTTRSVAWPDVQGIRIERNVNAAQHDLPERLVALYDREGRRIGLPHLNEREVGSLDAEVRALRELWELRRGAGWAPAPEATAELAARAAKAAEAERYALTPGMLATLAMGGSFPVIMGLFLTLGLATEVFDGISENLLAWVLIGSFPAVFLVTYVTSVSRRRRRR